MTSPLRVALGQTTMTWADLRDSNWSIAEYRFTIETKRWHLTKSQIWMNKFSLTLHRTGLQCQCYYSMKGNVPTLPRWTTSSLLTKKWCIGRRFIELTYLFTGESCETCSRGGNEASDIPWRQQTLGWGVRYRGGFFVKNGRLKVSILRPLSVSQGSWVFDYSCSMVLKKTLAVTECWQKD